MASMQNRETGEGKANAQRRQREPQGDVRDGGWQAGNPRVRPKAKPQGSGVLRPRGRGREMRARRPGEARRRTFDAFKTNLGEHPIMGTKRTFNPKTEFDSIAETGTSWTSSLYEITAKIDDGCVHKCV